MLTNAQTAEIIPIFKIKSGVISIEDISIYGEELPYTSFISKPKFKLIQNSEEILYNKLDDSLRLDIEIEPFYKKTTYGIDAIVVVSIYDAITNAIKQVIVDEINIGDTVKDKIQLFVSDTFNGTYMNVSILDKATLSALAPIMQWR